MYSTELRERVECLELALLQSHLSIIVEIDCCQLVDGIKFYVQNRSHFLHCISEIRALANQSRFCTFLKVEQSQVRVGYYLVNLARVERYSKTWLGFGPGAILQLLDHDRGVAPRVE
jgi:hypothetical protein